MSLTYYLDESLLGSSPVLDWATFPPGLAAAPGEGAPVGVGGSAGASGARASSPRTTTRFKKFGARVRFGLPPEDNWAPRARLSARQVAPAVAAPSAPPAAPQAIPMMARPSSAPPAPSAAPSALNQLDAELAELMEMAELDQDVKQDLASHSWQELADVFDDIQKGI